MSRDFLIRLWLPSAGYAYLGWWVGTKLVAIPFLQTFKILNIIGLAYDLIGLCILSRFISSNRKYQSLMSGEIAGQFMCLFAFSGLGLILCGQFGPNGPSKTRLELLSISLYLFLMMPTAVLLGNLVTGIQNKLPWSEETRTKIFGAYFLVGGITIQLYAAILDLKT